MSFRYSDYTPTSLTRNSNIKIIPFYFAFQDDEYVRQNLLSFLRKRCYMPDAIVCLFETLKNALFWCLLYKKYVNFYL